MKLKEVHLAAPIRVNNVPLTRLVSGPTMALSMIEVCSAAFVRIEYVEKATEPPRKVTILLPPMQYGAVIPEVS